MKITPQVIERIVKVIKTSGMLEEKITEILSEGWFNDCTREEFEQLYEKIVRKLLKY